MSLFPSLPFRTYQRFKLAYIPTIVVLTRFFPSLLGGLVTIYYINLSQGASSPYFPQFVVTAVVFIFLTLLYTGLILFRWTSNLRSWLKSIYCQVEPSPSVVRLAFREVVAYPSRCFKLEALGATLTIPLPCALYLYVIHDVPFSFLKDIMVGGILGIFTTISFTYFLNEKLTAPIRNQFFSMHKDIIKNYPHTPVTSIKLKVLVAFIIYVLATALLIGMPSINKLHKLASELPGNYTSGIVSLQWNIIMIALFSTIVVGWLAFLISKSLSKPVEHMVQAMDRIKSGDLSVRTMSVRDDEMGFLAQAFNEMIERVEDSTINLEKKVEQRTEELRQANSKLQQLDKAKSAFFANVSHELKTPMTLVVTPLENVLRKVPKGAPEAMVPMSTLETVRHNAYRLSGLISDLLDLTKSEIGKARISPVEISETREYFENIFNSVAPLMQEKELQFEFLVGAPGSDPLPPTGEGGPELVEGPGEGVAVGPPPGYAPADQGKKEEEK